MALFHPDLVPDLLMRDVPRDLVLAVEDALIAGAQRAFDAASGMADGHLPHVVGQLRHFHMNEAFHRALAAANASPTDIQGNGIVTGRSGMVTLGRFNAPEGIWINGRRSQTRRQMSMVNKAIEPLVQPGLFEKYVPASNAVVFFVACFSGSMKVQPNSPLSIQVAVPDRHMRAWLFRENLMAFAQRYDGISAPQHDRAVPTLKKNVQKRDNGGNAA